MFLDDPQAKDRWDRLMYYFIRTTGKKPNLNTLLFLIGVNEVGQGKKNYSKEEKQDLMHVATCVLLSYSGHYTLEGQDADGWPHFTLVRDLPKLTLNEQEDLLKFHMLEYFQDIIDEEIRRQDNQQKPLPPPHLKL
ncbi:MAG: hypothetical protein MUE33_10215 [Cytophagaceae bacterium]|jgi:hypothetical protein|nr:hypothetical protein [Cytophagaceae bacterium]